RHSSDTSQVGQVSRKAGRRNATVIGVFNILIRSPQSAHPTASDAILGPEQSQEHVAIAHWTPKAARPPFASQPIGTKPRHWIAPLRSQPDTGLRPCSNFLYAKKHCLRERAYLYGADLTLAPFPTAS